MLLLPIPHALFVAPCVADAALPVASGRSVGVLWRVFVSKIAVSLSEIGAHRQALVEHAALRVKQFLQRRNPLRSSEDGVWFETGNIRKVGKSVCNPIYRQPNGLTLVPVLRFLRSPPTVCGLIVTFVVDAINGKPVRTWPHVLGKGYEAFAPALADGDPTPTVMWVHRIALVETAAFHGAPNAVERWRVLTRHRCILRHPIKILKEYSSAV